MSPLGKPLVVRKLQQEHAHACTLTGIFELKILCMHTDSRLYNQLEKLLYEVPTLGRVTYVLELVTSFNGDSLL